MLIDRQFRFSSAQAITASAASTDLVDLTAIRDLGPGTPLWVVVLCTVAMTDTGSNSTLAVTLETDTAAAFSSATTAQTIGTFAALSAAGTVFTVPLAPFSTDERFLRVYYTTANGDLSAGSFTAFITTDPHNVTQYANGYTIS